MLLNHDRLAQEMDDRAFDAVIGTAAENVTYLSGFWALPQWIRPGPQAYAVWGRNHGPAEGCSVITSTGTLDLLADQEVNVDRVRRYGEFAIERSSKGDLDETSRKLVAMNASPCHPDPIDALVAELRELALDRGRIGIDVGGLLPGYLENLKMLMPEAEFIDAGPAFKTVRSVKTADEIERLRAVGKITEMAIDAALDAAYTGITEIEMARIFHKVTVEADAVPVLGCIGFGERSALMNVQPSSRPLKKGDIIRFDAGGRFKHYRADIARIAIYDDQAGVAGTLYDALRAGVELGAQIARPGIGAGEVFEAVCDEVRRCGIPDYARNHVGHGIGLDGYDGPLLSAASKDILEAGMVVCIETPYYRIGEFGLQVEDMFVITSEGAERLTEAGPIRVISP